MTPRRTTTTTEGALAVTVDEWDGSVKATVRHKGNLVTAPWREGRREGERGGGRDGKREGGREGGGKEGGRDGGTEEGRREGWGHAPPAVKRA